MRGRTFGPAAHALFWFRLRWTGPNQVDGRAKVAAFRVKRRAWASRDPPPDEDRLWRCGRGVGSRGRDGRQFVADPASIFADGARPPGCGASRSCFTDTPRALDTPKGPGAFPASSMSNTEGTLRCIDSGGRDAKGAACCSPIAFGSSTGEGESHLMARGNIPELRAFNPTAPSTGAARRPHRADLVCPHRIPCPRGAVNSLCRSLMVLHRAGEFPLRWGGHTAREGQNHSSAIEQPGFVPSVAASRRIATLSGSIGTNPIGRRRPKTFPPRNEFGGDSWRGGGFGALLPGCPAIGRAPVSQIRCLVVSGVSGGPESSMASRVSPPRGIRRNKALPWAS